jgi:hypothetical protein
MLVSNADIQPTQASSIEPIEYSENVPFAFNNFIYHATLSSPVEVATKVFSSEKIQNLPGTVDLPEGTTSLIIRLTNSHPGTSLNNTNRVENEVAIMMLLRQALANSPYSHIIPEVYAWGPVSSGQGFTILQHMPGIMPDKGFSDLSLADKRIIRAQMADIFALIQKFELPETINSFGGLTFDKNGDIVSAQMTLVSCGPFETYKDMFLANFKDSLKEADENPVLQGWKMGCIRERLEKYLESGLDTVLKVVDPRRIIAHCDFSK